MLTSRINPVFLLLIKKSLAMPRPQPLFNSTTLNPFSSFKLIEKKKALTKDFFDPYIEICFFVNTPIQHNMLETLVLASICMPNGISVYINAKNDFEQAKSAFLILNQLEIPLIFAPGSIDFLEEIAKMWLLDKRIRIQVYPFSDYLPYYVSKITGCHGAINTSLPSIISHLVYKRPEYKLNMLRFFEKTLPFQLISDSIKRTCTSLTIQRGQKVVNVRDIKKDINNYSKLRELIIYCNNIKDALEYESEIKAISKLTDVTISIPCLDVTEIMSVGNQLGLPMILRYSSDKEVYKNVLTEVFDAWVSHCSAEYSIYPIAAFIGNATKKLFINSDSKISCPNQSLYGNELKLVEKDVEDYIYDFLKKQKENILDIMRESIGARN